EESCVIRERKLRSVAESRVRFREALMSYTYYIYKTWEKVKSKYTMRICSLREHTLKHEWNQMVWSVNNLRCGTAATEGHMFLGHFAVALAAKKTAPKTSLGTFVLAAQFADLLWPVLLLFGIEQVRLVPGLLAASPFDFTSYPISHSLVAQLGWGAILGIAYFILRRDVRSALLVGPLVPTHRLLDFIAHRPDMPIYPGGTKYGLGMWNSVPLTILVEYTLLAAGIAIYVSVTRAKDRTGNPALWSLLGLLGFIYVGSVFRPPPPSMKILADSALAIWLTVPWAAWADRHRQPG